MRTVHCYVDSLICFIYFLIFCFIFLLSPSSFFPLFLLPPCFTGLLKWIFVILRDMVPGINFFLNREELDNFWSCQSSFLRRDVIWYIGICYGKACCLRSIGTHIPICMVLYPWRPEFSWASLLLANCYQGDCIKKGEVDGAYCTYRRDEKCIQYFSWKIWI